MAKSLPPLIALYSPAAQMGKGETAKALTDLFDYTLVKFAAPLKNIVAIMLAEMGVLTSDLHDYLEGAKKNVPLADFGFPNLTSRILQQTCGSEWGRDSLDRALWVKIALRKVQQIVSAGGRAVIDDMRFPNEYDAVEAFGGERWHIFRPRDSEPTNGHPSEGQLDHYKFHHSLINDGSIADLRLAISEYLR
ncbi:hypothetical protein [Mesorhizobium sp.]|uniref:deoxynucleotide monophosphate kinase family protein n=1 Tax=Mesorhizobium sp. TaxID=1871066 RepID=UPI000FE5E76B|nr:hypothetical protein [Mesorhizobium sp.]RWE37469.1 MAG: hypothetical protein EOS77_02500 [Mesorhizobium sp.]